MERAAVTEAYEFAKTWEYFWRKKYDEAPDDSEVKRLAYYELERATLSLKRTKI